MDERTTHISGIVVTAASARLDDVVAALVRLPGVEVRGCDRATGRIVVVQEADDVGAEVASFARIRALPAVLGADLVCHYFDGECAGEETRHPETEETRR